MIKVSEIITFSQNLLVTIKNSDLFSVCNRPLAGSKTEARGRKAHTHICREILELCEIIYDMGQYQIKYRDEDEDENKTAEDSTIIVRFGDLFQVRIFM